MKNRKPQAYTDAANRRHRIMANKNADHIKYCPNCNKIKLTLYQSMCNLCREKRIKLNKEI